MSTNSEKPTASSSGSLLAELEAELAKTQVEINARLRNYQILKPTSSPALASAPSPQATGGGGGGVSTLAFTLLQRTAALDKQGVIEILAKATKEKTSLFGGGNVSRGDSGSNLPTPTLSTPPILNETATITTTSSSAARTDDTPPTISLPLATRQDSSSALLAMRDIDGQTPLHIAALKGDTELTKILLDYGMRPDALDDSELTPLDIALEAGNKRVAEMLHAAMANCVPANTPTLTTPSSSSSQPSMMMLMNNNRMMMSSGGGGGSSSALHHYQQSLSPQLRLSFDSALASASYAQSPMLVGASSASPALYHKHQHQPTATPTSSSAFATASSENSEEPSSCLIPSSAFPQFETFGEERLSGVIVLVGLPARGKTYFARRVQRFFMFKGADVRSYSAGDVRRKLYPKISRSNINEEQAGKINDVMSLEAANFVRSRYRPREQCAAIIDGLNYSKERRRRLFASLCSHGIPPTSIVFLEVVVTNEAAVERHIAAAVEDFVAGDRNIKPCHFNLTASSPAATSFGLVFPNNASSMSIANDSNDQQQQQRESGAPSSTVSPTTVTPGAEFESARSYPGSNNSSTTPSSRPTAAATTGISVVDTRQQRSGSAGGGSSRFTVTTTNTTTGAGSNSNNSSANNSARGGGGDSGGGDNTNNNNIHGSLLLARKPTLYDISSPIVRGDHDDCSMTAVQDDNDDDGADENNNNNNSAKKPSSKEQPSATAQATASSSASASPNTKLKLDAKRFTQEYRALIEQVRAKYETMSEVDEGGLCYARSINRTLLITHNLSYTPLGRALSKLLMDIRESNKVYFVATVGETEAKKQGRIGCANSPLTAAGVEYSKRLADYLIQKVSRSSDAGAAAEADPSSPTSSSSCICDITKVLTCSSVAGRKTVAPFLEQLNASRNNKQRQASKSASSSSSSSSSPVRYLHTLDDLNYGDCDGFTHEQAAAAFPRHMRMLAENPYSSNWPRGESVQEMMQMRLEQHISELEAVTKQNIVLVVPQLVAQALVLYFDQATYPVIRPEEAVRVHVPAGHVVCLNPNDREVPKWEPILGKEAEA